MCFSCEQSTVMSIFSFFQLAEPFLALLVSACQFVSLWACELFSLRILELVSAGGTLPCFAGEAKTSGLVVPEKLDPRLKRRNNGGIFLPVAVAAAAVPWPLQWLVPLVSFLQCIQFSFFPKLNFQSKSKSLSDLYFANMSEIWEDTWSLSILW